MTIVNLYGPLEKDLPLLRGDVEKETDVFIGQPSAFGRSLSLNA